MAHSLRPRTLKRRATTTVNRDRRGEECLSSDPAADRDTSGSSPPAPPSPPPVVCPLEQVGVGREGDGRVGVPELAGDEDDVQALAIRRDANPWRRLWSESLRLENMPKSCRSS